MYSNKAFIESSTTAVDSAARLVTAPSEPLELQTLNENYYRGFQQFGMAWKKSADFGGALKLSYRIQYKVSGGTYQDLDACTSTEDL